jgi:hypothetical protein
MWENYIIKKFNALSRDSQVHSSGIPVPKYRLEHTDWAYYKSDII